MNNNQTIVSVIMSVYNSSDSVKAAIKSILSQTFQNLELLIIDDCSEDNTYNICKKFEIQDSRVRVFKNKKNIGLTKSLNVLLKHARGEYIARQDGDDVSCSSRLFSQYTLLEKNLHIDGCTTRAKIANSKRLIPGLSYYLPVRFLIRYKNPFIHGSLFIRKDSLNNIGRYDERFLYAQDYKLITDLINKGHQLKIIKQPLYELNMENNISTKFKKEQEYFARCVRKNLIP
jgi:glycosyltransferase involved in cell wall biosynthesis